MFFSSSENWGDSKNVPLTHICDENLRKSDLQKSQLAPWENFWFSWDAEESPFYRFD
jgi:hypothetical protein